MVAAVALIAAAALVGYYLTSSGGDDGATTEPVATVEDVYDRVAATLEAYDPSELADLTPAAYGQLVQPDLMQWQIDILRLDPVLSECTGSRFIHCDLTYGEDYFYSVVQGHNVSGSVSIDILDDETFRITAWPFPSEVKSVENELRDWIRATHPDVESRMFGNDAYGVFRFSEEALQLHADYLDEFMASRGS
jgi:hypothetical protein